MTIDTEGLRALLAHCERTGCPIGLQASPDLCSAGSCYDCLVSRLNSQATELEDARRRLAAPSGVEVERMARWLDENFDSLMNDEQLMKAAAMLRSQASRIAELEAAWQRRAVTPAIPSDDPAIQRERRLREALYHIQEEAKAALSNEA